MNINEIFSAFLVLFAVIDVFGAIPLIIAIKEKTDIRPALATLVTAVIMISFLFLGESMLKVVGVDIKSFAVAGSILMAFIAFEMLLGIQIFKDDDADTATASVIPLAFPLLAGAGSLTTILSIRAEYAIVNVVLAIILNMIVVYIVLRSVDRIKKLLGPVGAKILNKVFGIILLAIAVKLFSANAKALFL
ncbi:MarC family protein [Bacteroidia bacterium]|jgi:multiple antibiotic resistance protein|nr:MarC family protein [Bacteroidota bacterium]MDA8931028.1 MarC family protein [Bacteroidia bacterium]MDB4174416.1 MarC family protein [Bacteroidia bacterium]